MTISTLWWSVFYIALAGNIFGWAMTILRMLQNLDSVLGKLGLVAQLILPLGLLCAFVFGWTHCRKDGHLKVMIVWTASALLFWALMFTEAAV